MSTLGRIRIGALLAGIVLDHISAPILLAPVTFVVLMVRHGGRLPPGLVDAPGLLPAPLPAIALVSVLSSLFGGYAAGRMAGGAEGLHGALVGLGAVAVALLSEWAFPGTVPPGYLGIVSVPVVLSATLGGRLARPPAGHR